MFQKTIPQQICTQMFRTDTPVAQHAHTVSSERLTPVGRNLHPPIPQENIDSPI